MGKNRWEIRKRNNSWHVLYDEKLLVWFDTWEEARAIVSYTVRTVPIAAARKTPVIILLLTRILDFLLLVLGMVGVVAVLVLGHWYLFPIPLVFTLLAFRGFVLYRHFNPRS